MVTRKPRKALSILLASTMLASMFSLPTAVSAADTQAENSEAGTLTSYYSTNGTGVGVKKSITVDGEISDWNSSMLIAQGTANDDPRVYRPDSMYEVGIDNYALYGAWDDTNLYLMWEMTNVQDVVATGDNFPLTQGTLYMNQNLPFKQCIPADIGNICISDTFPGPHNVSILKDPARGEIPFFRRGPFRISAYRTLFPGLFIILHAIETLLRDHSKLLRGQYSSLAAIYADAMLSSRPSSS